MEKFCNFFWFFMLVDYFGEDLLKVYLIAVLRVEGKINNKAGRNDWGRLFNNNVHQSNLKSLILLRKTLESHKDSLKTRLSPQLQ